MATNASMVETPHLPTPVHVVPMKLGPVQVYAHQLRQIPVYRIQALIHQSELPVQIVVSSSAERQPTTMRSLPHAPVGRLAPGSAATVPVIRRASQSRPPRARLHVPAKLLGGDASLVRALKNAATRRHPSRRWPRKARDLRGSMLS